MKIYIIISLFLLVTGCASQKNYGDFTADNTTQALINTELAKDTVKQLETLYPAAKSKVNFIHETEDEFGLTFIKLLRDKGYAVSEYHKNTKAKSFDSNQIAYIIDNIDQGTIVVTILINNNSISRVYKVQQNKAFPLGNWSYKG